MSSTAKSRSAEHIKTLQTIIEQLPLPLALLGNGKLGIDMDVVNERFTDLFHAESSNHDLLLDLVRFAGGAWQKVRLQRPDGIKLETRVRSVSTPEGVLIVVDDFTERAASEEVARLRHRIAQLESEGRTVHDDSEEIELLQRQVAEAQALAAAGSQAAAAAAAAAADEAQQRIGQLESRVTELAQLSAFDEVTGAWNRAAFDRQLVVEISRSQRDNQPVSMLLVDVDGLSAVTGVNGQDAGDAALKDLAGRLQARIRLTDSLYRLDGGEFAVLAPGVGYRGAAVLAENLRAAAVAGSVTACIGVAEFVEGEGQEHWFHRADQALGAARSTGRNRVRVDRRGNSDMDPLQAHLGVVRLNWVEAYECGNPEIDAEHRELFDLGNALFAATMTPGSAQAWRPALENMLAHIISHFAHEERILLERGYDRLDEHRRVHAAILKRAREIAAAATKGTATIGALVNFLGRDVVARHFLTVDRQFWPLFRPAAEEAEP